MDSVNESNYSVALTGDSIIARKISVHNDESTKALYEMIKKVDCAFTNLEILPNNFTGHPAARSDGAHFAAHSYVLDDLKKIGFDLLSCANNHALDYGAEGLLETIKEIDTRGMSYSGVGKNLTEARMPVYYEVPGGTIALISVTSTFFTEDAAGEQRAELQGRPGVNPLRFDVEYEVTKEHLQAIKEIYDSLGIGAQRDEFIHRGFATKNEDKDIFEFIDSNHRVAETLNAKFRASSTPGVRTKPNEKDLSEMSKWVREAKKRADTVIVSLHAHEQGKSREHAAEFIEEFSRSIIDEGVDLVVGHGPHLIRGMEFHHGKPIFYSLGNFIGHNELIYKLPEDAYRRFDVDPSETPSEIFRKRSDDGKRGFPSDPLYWQTVMPICHFADGKLAEIEVIPVKLTRGNRPNKRGRPYLAPEGEREEILKKFITLSDEYGTNISDEDVQDGILRLNGDGSLASKKASKV